MPEPHDIYEPDFHEANWGTYRYAWARAYREMQCLEAADRGLEVTVGYRDGAEVLVTLPVDHGGAQYTISPNPYGDMFIYQKERQMVYPQLVQRLAIEMAGIGELHGEDREAWEANAKTAIDFLFSDGWRPHQPLASPAARPLADMAEAINAVTEDIKRSVDNHLGDPKYTPDWSTETPAAGKRLSGWQRWRNRKALR